MIKMIKNNKIVIALTLAIACLFTFCLQSIYTSRQTSNSLASIRTIETTQNELDIQSIFEKFEDASLETQGSITTFEGTKSFSLLDFYEYDLVSDFAPELESAEIKVKYRYDYDSEAKIITLTASMYDDGNTSTDTLIGAPFVNDKGNLDCVFDCDGEYILLSELQDAGLIENCGWFKNLCKKVSSAVQKVTNTVVGKVGTALTVAVPLVIGVVASVMAAPVLPVIAAGALVGACIAAGTAMISTHQQDGKIDWETVGICAGVGAAVGAIVSGVAYGFTKLIKDLSTARIYSIAFAVGTSPLTICSSKLNYIEALSVLAAYKISHAVLESYGLTLIPEYLFTSTMLEMLNLLRSNNVGCKYLGLYTPLKTDAAKLAFALGGVEDSVFDLAHGTGGYYQHYHDKEHIIHVWYGSPF